MEALIRAHSGMRWIVLLLLVIFVVQVLLNKFGRKNLSEGNSKMALYTLIFSHLQFLLGLVLFFTSDKVNMSAASMKDSVLRFFLVEHSLLMIVAILLITIGYGKIKPQVDTLKGNKTSLMYYGIALLLILVGIPWPFRGLGAGWF